MNYYWIPKKRGRILKIKKGAELPAPFTTTN